MTILFALFITGWVVAALIGTQAYFLGQSKPIHSRDWSPKFHALAELLTGQQVELYRVGF